LAFLNVSHDGFESGYFKNIAGCWGVPFAIG